MQKLIMKIGSKVMKALLRSPLHSLVSRNTLLITVIGRTTGREYSLPVSYVQDDDTLYIISKRCRTWWRNLRGGRPVRVWLRGWKVEGQGTPEEEHENVSESLKRFFQIRPDYAKYFDISLDANGKPDERDLSQAACDRLIVKVSLR